jgi:two-component system, cell cycle sensor histidine kinase and response regulator CckA
MLREGAGGVAGPFPPESLPMSARQPHPRRTGVLVVDDEPRVLSVTSALLALEGFRPFQAKDARSALDALRGHARDIDCALIDLHMPGEDGVATCRLLREARPGLPCWLITGAAPATATLEGFEGLVPKPFTSDALRARLDAL